MIDWVAIHDESSFQRLADAFNGFNDALFREAVIATDSFIDEEGMETIQTHRDASIILLLESDEPSIGAIEIKCDGVASFRLFRADKGEMSYVDAATFVAGSELSVLAIFSVFAPLFGPPNSYTVVSAGRPDNEPDIEVRAESFSWRRVPGPLGSSRRFWPAAEGPRNGDV